VLKLIGDGTLAIFTAPSAEEACRSAITAHNSLQNGLPDLTSAERTTACRQRISGVGLYRRGVLRQYRSHERLDFTVVGPAVNEVARIAAMCRSVERNVLLSQAFADATARLERGRLVSVGRYALRGVERPQELFTLDPFWTA
jgi:adenylate cyclase